MGFELTTSTLAPFLDLRTAVIAARMGDGGPDTCSVLTESLDASLRELAGGLDPDAAVVALGGYGRLWAAGTMPLVRRRRHVVA